MSPKNYILTTLQELSSPIPMQKTGIQSLQDAIYAKVMSKKFRKLKPGDECVKLTRAAIDIFVRENKPVRIFQMFGGNKLWRFEEAPEVDWAELFSLVYFIEWSRNIASVYEPGVVYEYFSQDISVERLNNIPRSETDRYSETFGNLLAFVKPYLPPNVSIVYKRHADLFSDPGQYNREIEIAKEEILKENNGRLPQLTDAMRRATELNVRLTPSQADDPLWREKAELEHQAIFRTKTLRRVTDDPAKIWTCPTYYADSVVTGSTKRSLAKFWAAVGVLQPNGNTYAELVLTPMQLQAAKYSWQDINIPELEGKNFRRIRVLADTE